MDLVSNATDAIWEFVRVWDNSTSAVASHDGPTILNIVFNIIAIMRKYNPRQY